MKRYTKEELIGQKLLVGIKDKEIKDYNKRIDKVNKKILKLNNIDV